MELRYTESGKSLIVEIEPGDGLAVYTSTITGWQAPHDAESFTASDKTRVIANIAEALRFLGVDFVLD
jgi:hypothetical protein